MGFAKQGQGQIAPFDTEASCATSVDENKSIFPIVDRSVVSTRPNNDVSGMPEELTEVGGNWFGRRVIRFWGNAVQKGERD